MRQKNNYYNGRRACRWDRYFYNGAHNSIRTLDDNYN